MRVIIFLAGFLAMISFSAALQGGNDIWADLGFPWLLAVWPNIALLWLLAMGTLGGFLQGALNQTAWWMEALAMLVPLLFLSRIDRSLFVENIFWRRALTGMIALVLWFVLLRIGAFAGLGDGPTLAGFIASAGFFITLIVLFTGTRKVYEKILR